MLGDQDVANQELYCADMYNCLNQPLAFQALSLSGFRDGYSIWVDVQNTAVSAKNLLQYLHRAGFIDVMSRDLITVINSFNPMLQVLTQSFVQLSWSASGLIHFTYRIETLRTCFYDTTTDLVHFAVEVGIFLSFLCGFMASCWRVHNRGIAGLVPLLGNMGMLSAIVFWWVTTLSSRHQVVISTSYSVYTDLFRHGHKLKLANAGKDVQMAAKSTGKV